MVYDDGGEDIIIDEIIDKYEDKIEDVVKSVYSLYGELYIWSDGLINKDMVMRIIRDRLG